MLWSERFALGIEVIDEQHKSLIELIEKTQELVDDAEEGIDCYDEIMEVLNELADYTVYHFTYEEELMAQKGYAALDTHAEQHEAFVDQVNEFLDSDIDEGHLQVIEDVVTFLLEWLSDHILVKDAAYVSVLES